MRENQRRLEDLDKRAEEKAKAARMKVMLENKKTIEMREKEREDAYQRRLELREQLQKDQSAYQRRLDAQRERCCGVGDLLKFN